MIRETIVTSISPEGHVHIAPMGVHHLENGQLAIMPFRPSTTFNNLLTTHCAVVNHCDDVRVFAGCITGHRDWPLIETERVRGKRLVDALAHMELSVTHYQEDTVRPIFYCEVMHQVNHAPFQGFNRAQFSVIEAAILVSRLERLPRTKILSELNYLQIGMEKTAGPTEREAWSWLMEKVACFIGTYPNKEMPL